MFHLLRTRITRPYRTSVALEEERVWVGFYRRVDNPAMAAEVIQYFDSDPELKRAHPALYLRCKEGLRRRKARQVRTKRLRSFMRTLLRRLLHAPLSFIGGQLRSSAGVVVDGLAESITRSTRLEATRLPNMTEIAAARSALGSEASRSGLAQSHFGEGAEVARSAKAA